MCGYIVKKVGGGASKRKESTKVASRSIGTDMQIYIDRVAVGPSSLDLEPMILLSARRIAGDGVFRICKLTQDHHKPVQRLLCKGVCIDKQSSLMCCFCVCVYM